MKADMRSSKPSKPGISCRGETFGGHLVYSCYDGHNSTRPSLPAYWQSEPPVVLRCRLAAGATLLLGFGSTVKRAACAAGNADWSLSIGRLSRGKQGIKGSAGSTSQPGSAVIAAAENRPGIGISFTFYSRNQISADTHLRVRSPK